jgi:glyceraldehyde 3-phosphate dehydrogenase
MVFRIGLWGFGLLGRALYRELSLNHKIELVCAGDQFNTETAAYLLSHDTIQGRFPHLIEHTEHAFSMGVHNAQWLQSKNPEDMPWKYHKLDLLLVTDIQPDYLGFYKSLQSTTSHAVPRIMLLSGDNPTHLALAPDDFVLELDATLPYQYQAAKWMMVPDIASSAILTPLRQLHAAFGIKSLTQTCIRAYSHQVPLADVPGNDLRTSRSAACNVIPTPWPVSRAIQGLLPENTPIQSMALQVPILNGSMMDLVLMTENEVTKDLVNDVIKASALSHPVGIEASDKPIASSDVIGSQSLGLVDTLATMVQEKHLVKLLIFFDSVSAYAHQIANICITLEKAEKGEDLS